MNWPQTANSLVRESKGKRKKKRQVTDDRPRDRQSYHPDVQVPQGHVSGLDHYAIKRFDSSQEEA